MSIKRSQIQVRLSGLLILFMLLTLLLGFSVPAPAAAGTAVPPPQPHPNLQALQAQARDQGQVRVIIGLNVPFTPEGELAQLDGPQAIPAQQRAIKAAQNRIWQQIAGGSSQLIANFKYIPAMAAIVDATALDKLASLPEVDYIQEDMLSAPTLASSIPVIGADDAWAAGYTGLGQTVAILDTGVDKTHTFLDDDKIVSEACYSSTGELVGYGRYESICPGGVAATTAVDSGIDCTTATSGYPAAQGKCDHGTHVAGIAAGDGGGGTNIGVAKDANIISVQVYSLFTDLDNVLSFSSDQILGMQRVYELRNDFNIVAVNMSLGGGQYSDEAYCDSIDPSRKAAIDTLRSVGIATIVSAGNGDINNIGYRDSLSIPACISSAISVGATDDTDIVASFSNVASFLDFFAPGVDIDSSVPGGGTESKPGTSMAAPHVAGAWAVLSSFANEATVDEILAALQDTGTLVDDNRTGGTVTDIPRINVDLALVNLSGSIIVEKQTIPDAAADSFTFSGTAAGTIGDGEQITVADIPMGTYSSTETVPAGWELTDITCDDANSSGNVTTGEATFNLDPGETVKCTFTNTKVHTLTVNTSGDGGVTAVPDQTTFLHGETVELTAAADPGWTFAGWSGSASGSENPLTVTMDGDKTITATFTQNEYTLTVNVVGGGSVDVVPDQAVYNYGDVVELTAVANTDWSFSGWSGAVSSTNNPISLILYSSETVTATFIEGDYALDVTVVGNGSVAVDPDKPSYGNGEVVALTATADPGWTFSDWSGDLISTTNPISHTMTSSQAITATFTQDEYTLTLDVVGNGRVTAVPDQTTYHYGDVVELTASADPGWTFSDWSGDLTSTDNPASITITGDQTVTANFTQDEYTLTLGTVGDGMVTAVPDQTTYHYGDEVELTAAADPGWTFSDWSGDVSSSSNPITFTISSNHAVTATFTQIEYTLSIDVVGDGTVTAVPDQAVYHYGDEVTLTAVPDANRKFDGWSGATTSTDNPLVFTVTGSYAFTAAFSPEYKIFLPVNVN